MAHSPEKRTQGEGRCQRNDRVRMTAEERKELDGQVNTGTGSGRRLRRARILLMADEAQAGGGWCDAEIAKALGAHARTVERVRERFTAGIEAALTHTRPKRKRPRVLDGAGEARLVQLACSAAPDGREQWTLQMLADKLVELEVVERAPHDAQKNELKPWLKDAWCIPKAASAEFVCAMRYACGLSSAAGCKTTCGLF